MTTPSTECKHAETTLQQSLLKNIYLFRQQTKSNEVDSKYATKILLQILPYKWKVLVEKILPNRYRCSEYWLLKLSKGDPEKLRSLILTKKTNTRQRDVHHIKLIRPQTNLMSKSVTYKLAVAWNSLPADIKSESNNNIFKRKLSKYDLSGIDFVPFIKNKKSDYVYHK